MVMHLDTVDEITITHYLMKERNYKDYGSGCGGILRPINFGGFRRVEVDNK